MKKILIVFFVIIYTLVLCQVKLKIVDSKNQLPIGDVVVYCNDENIGLSNKEGQVTVPQKCNNIFVSKNEYIDRTISIKDSEIITLDKIKTINIAEVIIVKHDINKVIPEINKKFSDFIDFPENLNRKYFYHISNNLSSKNKLISMNNIILFKGTEGYFFDDSDNFIKNYKIIKKDLQKYFLYDDKYVFWKSFTCVPSSLQYNRQLKYFLSNYKSFQTKIFNDNEFLKIDAQQGNSKIILIVNKSDYGIVEFTYERKNFKEKTLKFFNQNSQKYHIDFERYQFRTNRNDLGNYTLKSFSLESTFRSLEDQSIFNQTYQITQLENVLSENSFNKKFDICD